MKKVFAVLIFVSLLLSLAGVSVSATETRFATEELSQERKEHILSTIDFGLLTQETARHEIRTFDVNETHKVAIGYNHLEEAIIVVYGGGNFLYGYRFKYPRGGFSLEWAGDNMNIVFSEVMLTVTPDGEIVETAAVPDTVENNTYDRYLRYGKERVVDDLTYTVQYGTKVVITDANGTETVLYDVSADYIIGGIFVSVIIVFGVTVVVARIIREIKRAQNAQKETSEKGV